ncbi:uncharacterized protein E0L32_000627 [Thyridium curvatum]|uniref:Pentatricopeptide repeat-containing protein n=1 Tax=Thyridium curvatum TaxID=1093900 RepID=A0A507B2Z6_9PEZI|nr:uncharacterized protein E0L32_000627 [Thyridium curvatum]TPX14233.1 hypothetical protein E0L32_000627 [Thyridium curvatum]
MPPKIPLAELGTRNNFICRSCLGQLQKPQAQSWQPRSFFTSAVATARKQSPRTKAAPAKAPVEDESATVRFFQQDESGKLRQFRDQEDFSKAMNHDVELQLQELEGKLKEAGRLMKMIQGNGAKSQTERLKRQYRRHMEQLKDADDFSVSKLTPVKTTNLTPTQTKHVDKLNTLLRRADKEYNRGEIKSRTIAAAWNAYALARVGLAKSWDNVPADVWESMWNIFAADLEDNNNRMAHIYILSKDMNAARIPLGDPQQLLTIEAMFVEGWEKEAIENWKRASSVLGAKAETLNEYWELGIRMCSLNGDLDRAERAFKALSAASSDFNPRILVPFIRACASRDVNHERGWEAYRRLRDLLGDSMAIEDYDEVISCFLSSSQTDYALHVFVDMMFSGAIDVHGKTKLPSAVSNQFFLGKWLKRLIGAGDLDGAQKVLQFMQSKGIMAASVQVNGLIGAWLRSGTAENQEKADDLAWAMIRSRHVFVELRQREAALEWPLRLWQSGKVKENVAGLVFVPRATLETFSLMAENYRSRGLHGRLEQLWVAFKEADISTDAFMMNQLLESYVQNGKGPDALQMYRTMTRDHDLLPDHYTFLTLYKSLPINRMLWLSVSEEQKEADAVVCRELFRDMVGSFWVFEDDNAHEQLARLILHSFRKVEDYVGFIVAFRTLRELFKFAPTDVLTVEMVAETPDLHRDTPRTRKRIVEATMKIQSMLAAQPMAGAEDLENITPERKRDELAAVIEQYYRSKIPATEDEFEEMYDAAAQDLGVYDTLTPSGT